MVNSIKASIKNVDKLEINLENYGNTKGSKGTN